MRLSYPPIAGAVDIDEAVNSLVTYQRQHPGAPIKAVVIAGSTRPVAKFIERTRDLTPGLTYVSTSGVGGSALAEELGILGTRYFQGIVMTQAVPSPDGYASVVLEYKAALTKHASHATPSYTSLEAYLASEILIEGLKRAGPDITTEKLVDVLEGMKDFDLGIGAPVNFSRADHQAVHKVWGTQLDASGVFQSIDVE